MSDNADLTPYDTGARLEPKVWLTPPYDTAARPDPDRYGRVDFDDDEGTTLATVYAQRLADGTYVLMVEGADPDLVSVYIEGTQALPSDPLVLEDAAYAENERRKAEPEPYDFSVGEMVTVSANATLSDGSVDDYVKELRGTTAMVVWPVDYEGDVRVEVVDGPNRGARSFIYRSHLTPAGSDLS